MSKLESVREPACMFEWGRQRERDGVGEGVKSDPPQCLTFNHCLPTRDPMTSLNKRFCYSLPVVGETRASPTKYLPKTFPFVWLLTVFSNRSGCVKLKFDRLYCRVFYVFFYLLWQKKERGKLNQHCWKVCACRTIALAMSFRVIT